MRSVRMLFKLRHHNSETAHEIDLFEEGGLVLWDIADEQIQIRSTKHIMTQNGGSRCTMTDICLNT